MTDYNDGNWYGWNGGECPVHPNSVVHTKFNDGFEIVDRPASDWHWGDVLTKVVAFRVTKPYVEPKKPREFWVDPERCIAVSYYHADFIHVREVI